METPLVVERLMRCGLGAVSAGQGPELFAARSAEDAGGSIAAAATPTIPCSASRRVTTSSRFIRLDPLKFPRAAEAVGTPSGLFHSRPRVVSLRGLLMDETPPSQS